MSLEAIRISDALLAANVPYAGMSWGGFNLFGDDHSIKEMRRLQHKAGKAEIFRQQYRQALQDHATAMAEIAGLRDLLKEAVAAAPLDDAAQFMLMPHALAESGWFKRAKAVLPPTACPKCLDARWVCESHPDRPWGEMSGSPSACSCGGAGMPCPACNEGRSLS